MKYTSEIIPIPWRKDHDLSRYDTDPDYMDDAFSKEMWPATGFIDDLQAHTLGFETTNLITFWTAVHAMSATVQRKSWLHFGDGLIPNFFIVIVAPPARVHKSTALSRFDKIEREMWNGITNEATLTLFKPNIIRSKATTEQLFEHMKNRKIEMDGELQTSDASLVIRVSEMTTFLGKAQYLLGQIDKLTDWYDCNDSDTDSTIARGSQELENVFCTIFGCTTPDSFKNSIPETAFGGGFMSRCTIVQEYFTHRVIPNPYYPKEAPDRVEMAERLKWIWTYKRGEYKMTPEAYDAYKLWYRKDALEKRKTVSDPNQDHRDGRKSIITLKLATILAVQRYDLRREITREDFESALRIIEYTNASSMGLIEDVAVETQEDGRFMKFRRLLKEAENGITRVELARTHRFKKEEIDRYVIELQQRDEFREFKKNNKVYFTFKRTNENND